MNKMMMATAVLSLLPLTVACASPWPILLLALQKSMPTSQWALL